MAKPSKVIRELTGAFSQAHASSVRAGLALHDGVGPLLTGAGLQLQLLCLDQPEATAAVSEVLQCLDQAIEQIREVSQTLVPSLTYRIGLKGALQKLVQERQGNFEGTIRLKFSTTSKLAPELSALLYEAMASALSDAIARPGSDKVSISVTGTSRVLTARIQDNGRRSTRTSGLISRFLAEEAGFVFSMTTGRGTIVLIRHGIPRPPRG